MLNDADLKSGHFEPNDNEIFNLCSRLSQNKDLFVETSNELAINLFSIMKQNPDIPPGDIVFCFFEIDDMAYFVIMKLCYRQSYIHYVANTEDGTSIN